MLPRPEAFLAGIRLFVRRRPRAVVFDEPVITDALEHATRLASAGEQHEPAALFFACALRARAFGSASHDLLPLVARNQARGLGFRLAVDDVELAILHARIALGAILYDELRDRFAAALQPAGEDPGVPPRRPG